MWSPMLDTIHIGRLRSSGGALLSLLALSAGLVLSYGCKSNLSVHVRSLPAGAEAPLEAQQTDGSKGDAGSLAAHVIEGHPQGESNLIALSLKIGGEGVVSFRFKVGATTSLDCTAEQSYSQSLPASDRLAASVEALADGAIGLCLVGQNAAGHWQAFDKATLSEWIKDTMPPSLVIGGAPVGDSDAEIVEINFATSQQ